MKEQSHNPALGDELLTGLYAHAITNDAPSIGVTAARYGAHIAYMETTGTSLPYTTEQSSELFNRVKELHTDGR